MEKTILLSKLAWTEGSTLSNWKRIKAKREEQQKQEKKREIGERDIAAPKEPDNEKDEAVILKKSPGGIDLSAIGGSASGGNPDIGWVDVEQEGTGFSFSEADESTLARFKNVNGFTPVIFSVSDVKDILPLIGLAKP